MRILITAEAQGFGPSANAISILNHMNIEYGRLDFLALGTSYEYFNRLGLRVHLEQSDLKDNVQLLKRYDFVLSVMNSRIALLAKRLGLKVIYVDLIFWLFDFKQPFTYYKNKANHLICGEITSMYKELNFPTNIYNEEFMMHRAECSLLAHIVSDISIIEEFIPCPDHLKKYTERTASIFLPPILDKSIKRVGGEFYRDNILVALGGMSRQNSYCELMYTTFKKLDKVEVLGSSKIDGGKVLPPLEYFNRINQYDIVIAQPGFATIYEIIYLKKILIILPPQNAGQYKYVGFLKKYLHEEQFINWESIEPKKEDNDWDYMRTVMQSVALENKKHSDKLRFELVSKMGLIKTNKDLRKDILDRQNRFLNNHKGKVTENILGDIGFGRSII